MSKDLFNELMTKIKFKAVMLDIDGTLTTLGESFVPDYLKERLGELIEQGVPMAVCSGRHHPDAICDRVNVYPEKWTLFAENGACGYRYDNGWQEFYRVPWPSEMLAKKKLIGFIEENFEFTKLFNEASTLIFRPGDSLEIGLPELAEKCNQYQKELVRWFKEEGIFGLTVNNSKIGLIIGPSDGDKDRGILEFSKLLGIEDTREILCIGDMPGEGCNDEAFLSGKYGTPYSVGDERGDLPKGPKGTFELLGKFMLQ